MCVYLSRSFLILFSLLGATLFITQVVGQQGSNQSHLSSLQRHPLLCLRLRPLRPCRLGFHLMFQKLPQANLSAVLQKYIYTKLNPSTHKLTSECGFQAFCLSAPGELSNATGKGICVSRLCGILMGMPGLEWWSG